MIQSSQFIFIKKKLINTGKKVWEHFHSSPYIVRMGIVLYIVWQAMFGLLDWVYPLSVKKDYSTIITASDGSVMYSFLTRDEQWRMFTRLDEITPMLRKAFLFKEDRFFYFHPGINPASVIRALANNIVRGKRTSGASTITMQVARMLEPKRRTYGNKLVEMIRALQLERHFSKKEIFQLYLNLVPYGGNIEGVKTASLLYFNKLPEKLSIGEIATLSIIPNNPSNLRIGYNHDNILQERNHWLKKYLDAGLFKPAFIRDALDEPLEGYRREVPRLAPHLSYRLKFNYPREPILHTTLDMNMQTKIETLVKEYINAQYIHNIKNATVLVVDNETREVKAYIGSADFNNNEDGGQVDGIRALRSPGSTLKPLLYGLAFDKGIMCPKTVITDVPVSFKGYEPENYDGNFYGNVSVEFALKNSLNIPSVKVLNIIGPMHFSELLGKAGFDYIGRNGRDFGLSMILGGCGATLEELTGLFSTFANEGMYQPLKYLTTQNYTKDTTRIISKGSAFMITEILTQLNRPDLPLEWQNTLHMPKIAWKTGTSYGRKDAWSIGYNKKYTVGVWVGNFSAEGVPELSGAEKAVPLLFKIFNTIDYNSESGWYTMPVSLGIRYVCGETGKIPKDFCTNQVIDYFFPGISDMSECDHMKMVLVSPDSGVSYCQSCAPATGFIRAFYPNIKPEMITYYDQNNIAYLKIPPHNPSCERVFQENAPKIISPVAENDYYVDKLDSMQVMLSCETANDVEKVFWYINKKFYQSALPGEALFFQPPEGRVEISCSDDKGRNTDTWIKVKYISF